LLDSGKLMELISYTKNLKVLYVEDNVDTRESTLLMLENFFPDITVAINGQDGLDRFNESSFDLILSDINMPVMNGIDMIEKIRAKDDKIFIVILSAHNERNFSQKAEELNIDSYLIKPTELEDFLELLNKIMTNNKK